MPPSVNVVDEAEREQHRGIEVQHPSPQRRQPREDLDAGRHGDDRRGDRHRDADPGGHAGGEHVVRPDGEAEAHDRQQREGHHAVAEDRLARLHGDDFADDPEPGQHHDVDRRVGVEPEDVLVHQHVPALGGVEEVEPERRGRAG